VDGGTEITLTHEGVADEWMEGTPQGWEMILGGLERAIG
jgi:hypothetical protein